MYVNSYKWLHRALFRRRRIFSVHKGTPDLSVYHEKIKLKITKCKVTWFSLDMIHW